MPAQEERQPTEKILIDLPLIPHPGSIQLVSEHCEGTTPPPTTSCRAGKKVTWESSTQSEFQEHRFVSKPEKKAFYEKEKKKT